MSWGQYSTPRRKTQMKKVYVYAAGAAVLQMINSEVLSWIVLAIVALAALAKVFPYLVEGTK